MERKNGMFKMASLSKRVVPIKWKYQTGLKFGMVMENSNLGDWVWLWVLSLMRAPKKGFSALVMQRLIGLSHYEPM